MSAGQIHDLGYKRYVGSRRSVATRWTVILRQELASSWKTWWRFKVWLVAAAMSTAVAAGVLYFASGKMIRLFSGLRGETIQIADGIIPLSTQWYCKIGFVVSLTLGASVVAGDVESGAFTFYFARSLRPRDYVVGKLAGLAIAMSLVMLVGPLALAGVRLGLSDDNDQLIALLPVLPKALAIGVLGTLIYAAVPLGFSALVASRRYALALWAVYYIVIGSMAQGLGLVISPAIGAIDLAESLGAIAHALFGVQLMGKHAVEPPVAAAMISIAVQVTAAIGVAFWRVRRAQQAGVGGAS
jgi:ABC-type transport system involved in multi-copper enzyme maturation permease subunit